MNYDIVFLEEARVALKAMSPDVAKRVIRKVERMRTDLAGDVKRLKSFSPNYRLRVGDRRVLFDVDPSTIVIHMIKHRSEAYD